MRRKRRDAASASEIIGTLEQARRQFLALVDHVRPELLRYCARMTGSIADGEDVVQETLARACFELPQLKELPLLRPWLFRIAHHRAIDHWRHESLRASEPLDAALDVADAAALEPDHVVARQQAVRAAISSFPRPGAGAARLRHPQGRARAFDRRDRGRAGPERAAVKAALHRGRAALHKANAAALPAARPPTPSPALKRYAGLFNAHDWDGVRSLLADDVRLDLVSRRKAAGRRDVGNYLDNYQRSGGWHMAPAWFDGHEVLAVLSDAEAARPRYFIELGWARRTRRRDPRFPLRRLHRPGGRVRACIAGRRAGIVHGRTRSHAMKTELFYLLLTAILTGLLWIPVVIGYVTTRGVLTPEAYRDAPNSPLPSWVNRANRAHINAVENFAPFAAVVLIAHAAGISTGTTAACAAIYFYARLAHALVHISGFGLFKARTVLFTIAWIAFLVYAIVVLRQAF